MSKEKILGAFLLVNDYRILSNEEIADVKVALTNVMEENHRLKREIEKLYTIRVEHDCFIENIHIIDDYRITQLIKNKYLIELNDGTFADINEVVRENKQLKEKLNKNIDGKNYSLEDIYCYIYDLKKQTKLYKSVIKKANGLLKNALNENLDDLLVLLEKALLILTKAIRSDD